MIREGKIKAEKKSGKWRIHPRQLQSETVQKPSKGGESAPKKTAAEGPQKSTASGAAKSAPSKKEIEPRVDRAYTLAEFAEITYLTEFGVGLWLKQGRLTGTRDEKGEWVIDAANLQTPDVKRLVREDKAT